MAMPRAYFCRGLLFTPLPAPLKLLPPTPPIPAAERTGGSALRFGRGLGSWLGRGFVHRCRVGHVDGNAARVLLPRADVHADAAAAETAAADAAATGAHAHSAAAVAVRGPAEQHAIGTEPGRFLAQLGDHRIHLVLPPVGR